MVVGVVVEYQGVILLQPQLSARTGFAGRSRACSPPNSFVRLFGGQRLLPQSTHWWPHPRNLSLHATFLASFINMQVELNGLRELIIAKMGLEDFVRL